MRTPFVPHPWFPTHCWAGRGGPSDEEGELLHEATGKGVVNMARYYHHETVQVHGTDDDIRSNVRGGLDVTRATNYRPERSMPPPSTTTSGASRKARSNSTAGKKRSSSQTSAALPPSKRSCSASPTKANSNAMPNRVHRRVILRDYGETIYKASSRSALLSALEGCIEEHKSLRKAGFLHRDISINNLMINEDDDNISWPSFLIDLDLAVREQRQGASGARGKTGTRAFMAIGALLGEQHSFASPDMAAHCLASRFASSAGPAKELDIVCVARYPPRQVPLSRLPDVVDVSGRLAQKGLPYHWISRPTGAVPKTTEGQLLGGGPSFGSPGVQWPRPSRSLDTSTRYGFRILGLAAGLITMRRGYFIIYLVDT